MYLVKYKVAYCPNAAYVCPDDYQEDEILFDTEEELEDFLCQFYAQKNEDYPHEEDFHAWRGQEWNTHFISGVGKYTENDLQIFELKDIPVDPPDQKKVQKIIDTMKKDYEEFTNRNKIALETQRLKDIASLRQQVEKLRKQGIEI